jgi:hypothetical protein
LPRFVILRHELSPEASRPTHWDLMLEQDGVLRTWALTAKPSAGCDICAEELPDHRLAYLDYEGEISGDRGRVARVDRGEYVVLCEDPGALTLRLLGERLVGQLELHKVPGNKPPHNWVVRFAFCPPAA